MVDVTSGPQSSQASRPTPPNTASYPAKDVPTSATDQTADGLKHPRLARMLCEAGAFAHQAEAEDALERGLAFVDYNHTLRVEGGGTAIVLTDHQAIEESADLTIRMFGDAPTAPTDFPPVAAPSSLDEIGPDGKYIQPEA